MFTNKTKKAIKALDTIQEKIVDLKFLAYKWNDYNFSNHEGYRLPMANFCDQVIALTGTDIGVDELHHYFSRSDFEMVKINLNYIDLLISELKEQPDTIALDQEFFELLEFSILCGFYTGYDGGVVSYSRYNIDFQPTPGIIDAFEYMSDANGNFKSNLITEEKFNENSWLFEAFSSESDIQYEDYLSLFDLPMPSDYSEDNQVNDSKIKKSKNRNPDFNINDEIYSLENATSRSIGSLERVLSTLEFIHKEQEPIASYLGVNISDSIMQDILVFREDFHQYLRDLSVGLPVSTKNFESMIINARNLELEYKAKISEK